MSSKMRREIKTQKKILEREILKSTDESETEWLTPFSVLLNPLTHSLNESLGIVESLLIRKCFHKKFS